METTNLTFSPIEIATSSQTIYPCITKPLRFREYEYYIIVRGEVQFVDRGLSRVWHSTRHGFMNVLTFYGCNISEERFLKRLP